MTAGPSRQLPEWMTGFQGGKISGPSLEEFNVSPELAKIIGNKKVSFSQCMKRVWAYLKEKRLQDPEDKRWFTPDDTMAPVFGNKKIPGFGMLKYLKKHLTHLDGSSSSD